MVRGPSSTPGRQWWWMSIMSCGLRVAGCGVHNSEPATPNPQRLRTFQLALALLAALLLVVVVVIRLLVRVAVLVQVEVVEDGAEHRDVGLAETLGGALHEIARRVAA